MVSRLLLAVAALANPCTAAPPEVPPPGDGLDFDGGFADTILSFSVDGRVEDCAQGLGSCEDGIDDSCGPIVVLGMPDGQGWTLMPGDRVILGFRCSAIRENGGIGSIDLRLWATFEESARATVGVSSTGSDFVVVDEVFQNDPEIDLARTEAEVVQFVQIVSTGTGMISLDAIEAVAASPE